MRAGVEDSVTGRENREREQRTGVGDSVTGRESLDVCEDASRVRV